MGGPTRRSTQLWSLHGYTPPNVHSVFPPAPDMHPCTCTCTHIHANRRGPVLRPVLLGHGHLRHPGLPRLRRRRALLHQGTYMHILLSLCLVSLVSFFFRLLVRPAPPPRHVTCLQMLCLLVTVRVCWNGALVDHPRPVTCHMSFSFLPYCFGVWCVLLSVPRLRWRRPVRSFTS